MIRRPPRSTLFPYTTLFRSPRVHGAPHPVVHPRVVAADVELEDPEIIGGLGHGLEARVADRREHLGHAELARGLRRRRAAALDEGLDGADRREHHRNAYGPAEERGARVDLRDVAKDTRPEGDRVERLAVAPERRLGLRDADP